MIPERIKSAILNHVRRGQECGHFVTAVLENNLKEAVGGADEECIVKLREIVGFCYNKIPSTCWGSPEIVKEWREKGGEPLAHIEP